MKQIKCYIKAWGGEGGYDIRFICKICKIKKNSNNL